MRIRVCFAKTEAGRYLSHLDLARTLERSLRRAKAPLAFSAGFNPHLKMAIASALPVGVTGQREYFDVELATDIPIRIFSEALASACPPALAFVAAEEISAFAKSLSAVVNLAVYRIDASIPGADMDKVAAGIEAVLAADELWRKPKEKPGKKAIPAKEVRGLLQHLEILSHTPADSLPDNAPDSLPDSPSDGAATQASEKPLAQPLLTVSLEAALLLKADGQLQPKELWEMVAEAGGFGPAPPAHISRLGLWVAEGGKVYAPIDSLSSP